MTFLDIGSDNQPILLVLWWCAEPATQKAGSAPVTRVQVQGSFARACEKTMVGGPHSNPQHSFAENQPQHHNAENQQHHHNAFHIAAPPVTSSSSLQNPPKSPSLTLRRANYSVQVTNYFGTNIQMNNQHAPQVQFHRKHLPKQFMDHLSQQVPFHQHDLSTSHETQQVRSHQHGLSRDHVAQQIPSIQHDLSMFHVPKQVPSYQHGLSRDHVAQLAASQQHDLFMEHVTQQVRSHQHGLSRDHVAQQIPSIQHDLSMFHVPKQVPSYQHGLSRDHVTQFAASQQHDLFMEHVTQQVPSHQHDLLQQVRSQSVLGRPPQPHCMQQQHGAFLCPTLGCNYWGAKACIQKSCHMCCRISGAACSRHQSR